MAPHKVTVTQHDLSPVAQQILIDLKRGKTKGKPRTPLPSHKSEKLTSTFADRVDYVTHGLNLKFYVKEGMKLKKISKGIKFKQSSFIRPFIELCTRMRREAKTKQESMIYKFICNSLYGKLIGINDNFIIYLTK